MNATSLKGVNADWLSSCEICVKVQIFELEGIFRATNSRERARLCTAKVWRDKSKIVACFLLRKIRPKRVYTFTLYGILSPRRVWCEHTARCSRHSRRLRALLALTM